MPIEKEQYFAKALESLASGEDDFVKERFNSSARGVYYALFQAAVAALIHEDIEPRGPWDHEFVHARFSGQLVYRQKVYPAHFRRLLIEALLTRRKGDYKAESLHRRDVQPLLDQARALVELVKRRIAWPQQL